MNHELIDPEGQRLRPIKNDGLPYKHVSYGSALVISLSVLNKKSDDILDIC